MRLLLRLQTVDLCRILDMNLFDLKEQRAGSGKQGTGIGFSF